MVSKLFKHFMPYAVAKAYEFNNDCDCGARANPSYIFKPDLLDGPIRSECMRHTLYDQKSCFRKWSIAILKGDCKERREIEKLIVLGKERDVLLDRLAEVNGLLIEAGVKGND